MRCLQKCGYAFEKLDFESVTRSSRYVCFYATAFPSLLLASFFGVIKYLKFFIKIKMRYCSSQGQN